MKTIKSRVRKAASIVLGVLFFSLWLSLIVGIYYVIGHFIVKYW